MAPDEGELDAFACHEGVGVDVDRATHAINQRLSQIACHFISMFVHLFHSQFVFFGENHLTIF